MFIKGPILQMIKTMDVLHSTGSFKNGHLEITKKSDARLGELAMLRTSDIQYLYPSAESGSRKFCHFS